MPVLPERGGSFAMTVVGAVPRAETSADLDAEHSPGVSKWRASCELKEQGFDLKNRKNQKVSRASEVCGVALTPRLKCARRGI
eukprot:SAG11_NODE_16296_length_551_cov_2.336283_2_plen_82_part_01